jgi:membrane protease YdiL (CAAX protease family)
MQETQNKNILNWGPKSSLIVSFLAYFISQFILIIPLAFISVLNPGQSIEQILNNSPWIELALAGVSSATILIILYVFLKIRKRGFKDLGFKKPVWADLGWLAIGFVVYLILLAITLAIASQIPGFNADQAQQIGYTGVKGWQILLAFTGLVILPPIAEEMMFRGFLYRGLTTKWPKILSAFLASGLFALVHFQWNVGVDVFVLSLILIFLLEKTKNLWVCVALHAIKNGLAFLALFVFVGR